MAPSFESRNYAQQYAQKKVMDFLARRDHSEKELREKLKTALDRLPDVTASDVEAAIEQALLTARTKHWLRDDATLATELAQDLHRKNKGYLYINQVLEAKGLPPIREEEDLELEKARRLVKNKYSGSPPDRARAAHFLAGRGFDPEIVRKVIYEKF